VPVFFDGWSDCAFDRRYANRVHDAWGARISAPVRPARIADPVAAGELRRVAGELRERQWRVLACLEDISEHDPRLHRCGLEFVSPARGMAAPPRLATAIEPAVEYMRGPADGHGRA
jgi:hypothetical protein